MSIKVETLFDPKTFTVTHIVFDPHSKDAIVIDPVWDYDQADSKVCNRSVDIIADFIKKEKLNFRYILETHVHADHLSGSSELKNIFPKVKIAIGKNITKVQEIFKDMLNLEWLATDGSQFDLLLEEGEDLQAGTILIQNIETPGHTPACMSFLIEDRVFTGDALFMPDSGTGRCDFPGGSAEDLYNSINKLYSLPNETKTYTGHDYAPGGRELQYISSIGESKRHNTLLKEGSSREEFVKVRVTRDATLNAPKLIFPSLQVNLTAGLLPVAESNGSSYIKIPISRES